MYCQLTLQQINKIIGNSIDHISDLNLDKLVTGVTTDTRSISFGEVFVALQGENYDGHDFVDIAVEKGAMAIITDRVIPENLSKNVPQLYVKNTLDAYQKIAHWWRNQFEIPVIGITGSVGKTTTKELIASVLSTQGKVHKTQANYNNEIGVPKTLLELKQGDDYAVIEMAMRARGEIALLTQIARPTIGIITNVGTAHIGRLGSEQAIAQAKCELLEQMPKTSIAILNHDNERLIKTAATVWQGETITYGLEGGDVHGEMLDYQTLRVNKMNFSLPLPGRHIALNYLAALAVTKVLKIDWNCLTEGVSVTLPSGRSRRYQLPNDILILDETYNAGLESMIAALHLLKETPGKRHLAVLGTMKELGEHSEKFHHQVGETVKHLGINQLLVLVDDPETEAIAVGASGVPSECFHDHEALVNRLKEIVQSGDRILFKASNSVGLNQVVEKVISQ